MGKLFAHNQLFAVEENEIGKLQAVDRNVGRERDGGGKIGIGELRQTVLRLVVRKLLLDHGQIRIERVGFGKLLVRRLVVADGAQILTVD